jgi:hypothetical protein
VGEHGVLMFVCISLAVGLCVLVGVLKQIAGRVAINERDGSVTWKDVATEFEKMKSAKTLHITPDAPLMQEVFVASMKKYAAGTAANGIKQLLLCLSQHAETNESSFLHAAMSSEPREYAVREVEAAGVGGPGVCELCGLPD